MSEKQAAIQEPLIGSIRQTRSAFVLSSTTLILLSVWLHENAAFSHIFNSSLKITVPLISEKIHASYVLIFNILANTYFAGAFGIGIKYNSQQLTIPKNLEDLRRLSKNAAQQIEEDFLPPEEPRIPPIIHYSEKSDRALTTLQNSCETIDKAVDSLIITERALKNMLEKNDPSLEFDLVDTAGFLQNIDKLRKLSENNPSKNEFNPLSEVTKDAYKSAIHFQDIPHQIQNEAKNLEQEYKNHHTTYKNRINDINERKKLIKITLDEMSKISTETIKEYKSWNNIHVKFMQIWGPYIYMSATYFILIACFIFKKFGESA